ncbi:MAG: maleylpyruvate isomerase family mycothiol-dependent enzyme [Acidimicrobiia bacterium]|nr:maleylpyruvate isomerase family mycothiol-dependent enzyme [Acidimicrobiia bacterium]
MVDFLAAIRTESARFAACLRAGSWDAPVPSCPGWTLADLAWHLTEVQHYWASIASDLLLDPGNVTKLERPANDDLPDLFDDRSAALTSALERHPAATRCWSWAEDGWSIGWVRRRQAHEALIHRVDAELAVGSRTDVDPDLARDGVDEVLTNMVFGIPEWADFIPDESVVTLSVDGGPVIGMRFGRMVGTGPESGTDYDFETLVPAEPGGPVVAGTPQAVDLWLWGRGGESDLRTNEPELVSRIRAILADATQ